LKFEDLAHFHILLFMSQRMNTISLAAIFLQYAGLNWGLLVKP
jgi:hypothetical protein